MKTGKLATGSNPDVPVLGLTVSYPGRRVRELGLNREGGESGFSPSWKNHDEQLGEAVEMQRASRCRMEFL